jgi:hypothetical protein
MKQGQADTITLPKAVTGAPLAIELRRVIQNSDIADRVGHCPKMIGNGDTPH